MPQCDKNKERDEIYSDLSLIKEFDVDKDFLSILKNKFKSFRYKISDSFNKSDSFFDDIVDK